MTNFKFFIFTCGVANPNFFDKKCHNISSGLYGNKFRRICGLVQKPPNFVNISSRKNCFFESTKISSLKIILILVNGHLYKSYVIKCFQCNIVCNLLSFLQRAQNRQTCSVIFDDVSKQKSEMVEIRLNTLVNMSCNKLIFCNKTLQECSLTSSQEYAWLID